MGLILDVTALSFASGADPLAGPVSAFYIGLAIATRHPERGSRLLRQLEREMAAIAGEAPEAVETRLREAAEHLAGYFERAVKEAS